MDVGKLHRGSISILKVAYIQQFFAFLMNLQGIPESELMSSSSSLSPYTLRVSFCSSP